MSNESRQEEITAGAIRQTLDENILERLKQSAEKSLVEWKKIKEQSASIHNANHQISWLEGYLKGLSECPPVEDAWRDRSV